MRQALLTEPARTMSKAEVAASERLADTATRVCGHPVGRAEAQQPVLLKEMDVNELALFNMRQRLEAMELHLEARDRAIQDTLTALTQHLLPESASSSSSAATAATLRRRATLPNPSPHAAKGLDVVDSSTLESHAT